ncbi:hypothetical protein G6F32_013773 [Rhizopus arrhizus]|nr:hypothetical protein G6F32_013773 [Rhizopus arrhizus]
MNANLSKETNKQAWWRPIAPRKEDFSDPDEYYKNMLQDYFHTYYQQEGYDSLAIQERVKEQAQIMDWPISASFKEVLQPTVAHINTSYNPLPYYPCSDQSIKEWDDLLLEDWQKGNLEAANITKKHILESYSEYKKAQQELKRSHRKKQNAIEELAT